MQYKQTRKIIFNSPLQSANSEQSETKITYFRSTNQIVTATKNSNISNKQRRDRRPISLSHQMSNKKGSHILHFDKQQLSEENQKLKQTIALLNAEIIELRAKMTISERETRKATETGEELTKQMQKEFENLSIASLKKVNLTIQSKLSKTPTYSRDQLNVKFLEQSISNLKREIEAMRKSIKYTQLKQLQIENEEMRLECQRTLRMMSILEENNKQMQTRLKDATQNFIEKFEKQAQKTRILLSELRTAKQQLAKSIEKEQKHMNELNKLKNSTQFYKESKEQSKRGVRVLSIIPDKKMEKRISKDKDKEGEHSQPIFHHRNRIVQAFEQLISFEPVVKPQNKELKTLAETLRYRFQGFQYSLEDLAGDIKTSGVGKFDSKQLRVLLSCQPFMLNQSSLDLILSYLNDGKQDPLKSMQTSVFLAKIYELLPSFIKIQQKKYYQCRSKWQKHLQKVKSPSRSIVTKQQFEKWIIRTLIKDEQMQFLIGEAGTVSETINKINIAAFLQHLLNNQ